MLGNMQVTGTSTNTTSRREDMRKEFDWDRYSSNKTWVHIKNKEELEDFIGELEKNNCFTLWGGEINYRRRRFEKGNRRYFCMYGTMTEEEKKELKSIDGMCYVEWSDYMEKKEKTLKENYLVSGNVIKTREGGMYLLVDRRGALTAYDIKNKDGIISGNCEKMYDDNLRVRIRVKELDIIKVFISNINLGQCAENDMELLWERKEEMTKEEVRDVLMDIYNVRDLEDIELKALGTVIDKLKEEVDHDTPDNYVKDKAVDYDAWDC